MSFVFVLFLKKLFFSFHHIAIHKNKRHAISATNREYRRVSVAEEVGGFVTVPPPLPPPVLLPVVG
jgi:hypothetical protein